MLLGHSGGSGALPSSPAGASRSTVAGLAPQIISKPSASILLHLHVHLLASDFLLAPAEISGSRDLFGVATLGRISDCANGDLVLLLAATAEQPRPDHQDGSDNGDH